MTSQFDLGHCVLGMDNIAVGVLCCAKYKDGVYYRARVVNTEMLHQNLVEVHFIDYGNRDFVTVMNLRTITNFAPALITIVPQAKEFILTNITHQGVGWDNNTIALISNEIRYMELECYVVNQISNYTLLKLFKGGDDIALSLFNRGLVLSIASTAQNMILQNISLNSNFYQGQLQPALTVMNNSSMSNLPSSSSLAITPHSSPTLASTTTTLLAYKAITLDPDSENNVYVSYVSDGPCQFSIQLETMEEFLARLMNELNKMPLHPLEENPLPGTVCVSRCVEDDHICRAVVTSMVDGQYKVFYVDFGNTEVVPFDNLYQIPFKYVIPKVMAMRYALAGIERSSVTLEMKCAFKEFVTDKLLRMKTIQPASRSALPLCNLLDSNNVNVLDVLQRAALLAYPEIIQLSRGFSQEVRVSFVISCSHFYVQIKSKEEELRKVMAELQVNCPNAARLEPSQVKVGLPCCVLFETDNQWYRAQILSSDGNKLKVRYVDYGNEETIDISNIRMPSGDLLIALRPQAIECCLNGYQNMENDLERDTILEELILEKEFTMKIVEMQNNRALVDLIDCSRYNVASLLLEKLANARSQVSPILIQDTHHIQQRKKRGSAPSTSQNFRLERKTSREASNDNWNKSVQDNDVISNRRDFGDKGSKNNKSNAGWREKSNKPWNNNKNDSWRQGNSPRKDQSEEGDGFYNRPKRDNVKKNNDWSSTNNTFKKSQRSPNPRRSSGRRESSEKSWSDGSEKNWRKNKGFNNDGGRFKRRGDSEDVSAIAWNTKHINNNEMKMLKVKDPAPNTAVFLNTDVMGKSEKILISWFHDPSNFFCRLYDNESQFKIMMEDIQNTYCKINPESLPIESPCIALFPEDGVMYRANILKIKQMMYRVQFVDFGNVCTTTKVWPIENKFMLLPAQAMCCALKSIKPVESEWSSPEKFSSYFDKESFMCTFLSSNNKHLVELKSNDENVSDMLVSAGLAQYDEESTKENEFSISILIGQQIKVVIELVNGLDNFFVRLPNNLHVLCTMYNLKYADHTFENTLKHLIGCITIMYVNNVLEDRLEITLFDANGNKLKMMEPDKDTSDKIDILCPMPVLYSTIKGWISHFIHQEGVYYVFFQPAEYTDTISHFLDSLFQHYNDSTLETPLQPDLYRVYAICSVDGNWYRGQVKSVENEEVDVMFIDYGNSEKVLVSNLRELDNQFKEQHLLALQLAVTDFNESCAENEVIAKIWLEENDWNAKIIVALDLDNTKPLESETITEKNNAEQYDEKQNLASNNENVSSDASHLTNEKERNYGVAVLLSHFDSPNEFYLQLSDAADTVNILQETLQERVVEFLVLENPTAGILCAAPYSIDQQWYRAQVLDADSDITTVRFVDYGNTDVLTNETTQVKTLPSDLISLEQYARRCSLIIKPIGEWSPAACERFENLTHSENLTAEILHQDEKTTYVELYADSESVRAILLKEGLAEQLQLETESSCTGYVSHLNSPSEFWVQLENSVADLEWIAEQLSTAESFPELDDLTPGFLCAALYSEDEMWYRARILSNTVAGLEVIFIDYGNSCTCNGLRQLPEDLVLLPALAQKCSLQKPSGILQWSPTATDEFKNISADGASIFNIEKLSTGETSIVKLYLNDIDITEKLVSQTENVYITQYNSISSFCIQKVDDQPKLATIIKTLCSASEWPKLENSETSDLVAAFSDKDNLWYRAKILNRNESTYEVLFIDYGNTATTNEVRQLCDVQAESPLSLKCKLDVLPGLKWTEESSTKLQDIIANAGKEVFQVEFISSDIVRLFLSGKDVRSILEGTCVSSVQNSPKKKNIVTEKSNTPTDTEKGIDSMLSESSGISEESQNCEFVDVLNCSMEQICNAVILKNEANDTDDLELSVINNDHQTTIDKSLCVSVDSGKSDSNKSESSFKLENDSNEAGKDYNNDEKTVVDYEKMNICSDISNLHLNDDLTIQLSHSAINADIDAAISSPEISINEHVVEKLTISNESLPLPVYDESITIDDLLKNKETVDNEYCLEKDNSELKDLKQYDKNISDDCVISDNKLNETSDLDKVSREATT